MRIIQIPNGNTAVDKYSGIGLGTFDGLHIGHMTLINTLVSECRLLGLTSIVYTFLNHPENTINKKPFTSLITLQDKKVELLSETMVDYLYFEEFNDDYSKMSPEEFVKNILLDKFNMKLVVVGFNYRFGYNGQGDVNVLKRLGEKYRFKVIIIPEIRINNEVVSSSLIREYIRKGDMDTTFKLLGRHYSINGKVVCGKQIGNKMGFPTANIEPVDCMAIPSFGVYLTVTVIDGEKYYSITNIGVNPTIGGRERPVIETNIFDVNQDLYGKRIEVFFITKLREEKSFKSKDDLIAQIGLDVNAAKTYFSLFGNNGRSINADDKQS